MTDNPTYPPTGLAIAADDVLGALHQIIKVAYGADGFVTLVDEANPFPVRQRLDDVTVSKDSGLDANAATAGTALDLTNKHRVGMVVDGATGTHATHIVTLQVSADNSAWHNTSTTITGAGAAQAEVFHKYARALVTTLEGGASTIDITLQAK